MRYDAMRAAARLRAVREAAGFTQRELARRTTDLGAPVSYGSISQIERGARKRPSAAILEALAHALGWPSFQALVTSEALDPPGSSGAFAANPAAVTERLPPAAPTGGAQEGGRRAAAAPGTSSVTGAPSGQNSLSVVGESRYTEHRTPFEGGAPERRYDLPVYPQAALHDPAHGPTWAEAPFAGRGARGATPLRGAEGATATTGATDAAYADLDWVPVVGDEAREIGRRGFGIRMRDRALSHWGIEPGDILWFNPDAPSAPAEGVGFIVAVFAPPGVLLPRVLRVVDGEAVLLAEGDAPRPVLPYRPGQLRGRLAGRSRFDLPGEPVEPLTAIGPGDLGDLPDVGARGGPTGAAGAAGAAGLLAG